MADAVQTEPGIRTASIVNPSSNFRFTVLGGMGHDIAHFGSLSELAMKAAAERWPVFYWAGAD
jgi:hypothetical protein